MHARFDRIHSLDSIRSFSYLDALQKYHQVNGTLPGKIIVYRDGVNDFQLLDVIDSELPALNELCMKIQEGYE